MVLESIRRTHPHLSNELKAYLSSDPPIAHG